MRKLILLLGAILTPALQAAPPNIVILYADDMGYGDLGANNPDSKIPTPHLDKLADEGMRFTDGHSSSGICTPSRYALLTGRHHWRDFHGIVNALGPSVFKPDQLTLPEMLRQKGYTTACIGKWHLGWDWDAIRKPGSPKNSIQHDDFDWSKSVPDGPLDHGFDHYFGDTVINFPPYAWIEDNKLVSPPDTTLGKGKHKAKTKEGNWETRPGPARSDWDFYDNLPMLTRKAVAYLEKRKDEEQPFFLFVPFPSPHAPIIPTDEFDGKSQAGAYGDYVVQTDDSCGQILDALHKAGLDQNTVVIFTADNGPERYAFTRDQKYDHWSSKPFRGLKRDIYEGGHHVPFLIKWPGTLEPGSSSASLISQVDFMATFADLLDYELPDNSAEDSHNFLPHFERETKASPRNTMVHNTYAAQYGLRHNNWLLIDHKTGENRPAPKTWSTKHETPAKHDQAAELYDLSKDIGQRNNLAAQHPETVTQLKTMLKQVRDQGHSAPRLD